MLGVIAEATEAVETSRDLYGTEGWWWREREGKPHLERQCGRERQTDTDTDRER